MISVYVLLCTLNCAPLYMYVNSEAAIHAILSYLLTYMHVYVPYRAVFHA